MSPALTPSAASQAGMAMLSRPCGMPWAKYIIEDDRKRTRVLSARTRVAAMFFLLLLLRALLRRVSSGPVTTIGRGVETPRQPPESGREARPQRGVAAAHRVKIPAAAAAAVPYRAREPLLQPVIPGALGVLAHLDHAGAAALHPLQRAHHVADLALDHQDYRVVTQCGVRPEQGEEIREAGHRGALVGGRPVRPQAAEVAAAATNDHAGR